MKRGWLGSILFLCIGSMFFVSACFQSACMPGNTIRVQEQEQEQEPERAYADVGVPEGFLQMEVLGLLPTTQGNAVFLNDREKEKVLPIWIGPAEAMSIQLRLDRRRFERPLTHDLLDSVLKELGGHVVRIQIEDLKGTTFVASIIVMDGNRTLSIDSRPSDAIAVALGNRAPIYVDEVVLERAGLGLDDIPESPLDNPSIEGLIPEDFDFEYRDESEIISPPPTQSL